MVRPRARAALRCALTLGCRQQRYYVNDTFWNPANPGPIFCTDSFLDDVAFCMMTTTIMMLMHDDVGGMFLTLECQSMWAVQMGGEGAVGPEDVVELQMVQYGAKWGADATHTILGERNGLTLHRTCLLHGCPQGALMVTLEHRFYGKSQPLPDLSIESLRFLSSEQACVEATDSIWSEDQPHRVSFHPLAGSPTLLNS